MDIRKTRELVCESGRRLLEENLVEGTWGNISCRIDKEQMLITPSGKRYEELTPEDMVIVDFADLSYTGGLKPSSEVLMHRDIYRANKEINAVVHTHSLYACIIAALGTEVLPYIADMAMILGPNVRVVKHRWPENEELSRSTLEGLKDRYAVILKNHGAICIGRDMEEAFTACRILEKACQIQANILQLGTGEPINQKDAEKYRERYLNVYQKK